MEVLGWAGAFGPDGGETFLTVVFPTSPSETQRIRVSRELLHSVLRFSDGGDILEGGFSPVVKASGPPFQEVLLGKGRMRRLLDSGYAYAVVVFKPSTSKESL